MPHQLEISRAADQGDRARVAGKGSGLTFFPSPLVGEGGHRRPLAAVSSPRLPLRRAPPPPLPLWEKVAIGGLWPPFPHPSSLREATLSHKGRGEEKGETHMPTILG